MSPTIIRISHRCNFHAQFATTVQYAKELEKKNGAFRRFYLSSQRFRRFQRSKWSRRHHQKYIAHIKSLRSEGITSIRVFFFRSARADRMKKQRRNTLTYTRTHAIHFYARYGMKHAIYVPMFKQQILSQARKSLK